MATVQIKRGLKANLPTSGLLAGEQLFTTDRNSLHVATGATTTKPVVPPIDDLTTLAAVDGTADLVMIFVGPGTGVRITSVIGSLPG